MVSFGCSIPLRNHHNRSPDFSNEAHLQKHSAHFEFKFLSFALLDITNLLYPLDT